MKKAIAKRVVAAAVAALLTVGCINLPVVAEELTQMNSKPGSSFFEAVDYSGASVGDSVLANDNAADSSSIGGDFAAGNYLEYKGIDFGQASYNTILILISALQDQQGKTIELRLDSPNGESIGSITVNATGDATLFEEHYATVSPVSGVHDLYLVFPEAASLNLDFFTLSSYNGSETEEEMEQRMQWFRDAKFGQFIHFGAYSHLEGDYNGRRPNGGAEWIMKLLNISKEDYARDAAKPFNPTEFDAKEYVSLAKAAGQKYLVFTTRHHEGFSMFETGIKEFRDYQLSTYGEYQGEDPVKALSEECKKQGIAFATYYSIPDWHDKAQSNYDSYIDPDLKDDYIQRMKGQLREIIENYDPEILWFDGNWMNWWTHQDALAMYRYVRTLKPSILINNRVGTKQIMVGDYGTPEQTIPATGLDYAWESCMTLNGTWGYSKYDNNWKSTATVVDKLVDVASKGGNYLLNIGPDALGRIPEQTTKVFTEVGEWLEVNGESIYETDSNCFEKLPSGVRATTKDGKVYLHISKWNSGSVLVLPKLKNTIHGMKVLGTDTEVSYANSKSQLTVTLPDIEANPYDTVIEIDVEGKPEAVEQVNLAKEAISVTQSNYYRNNATYNGEKAVDGNGSTRWATDDGVTEATLELTFAEPVTFNKSVLNIHGSPKNNVKAYQIEYWDGNEWISGFNGSIAPTSSDIVVTETFDSITADRVRLHITDATNPTIYEFELYNEETYEIQITSPSETTIVPSIPFAVSGTSVGGSSVSLAVSGKDFAPVIFTAPVQEDGSWVCEVDPPSSGRLTIIASLLDEDGEVTAVTELTPNVRNLGENLVTGKNLSASTVYGNQEAYNAAKAADGDLATRWSPKDGDENVWLAADFGQMKTFDTVIISEFFDIYNQPNDYRCTKFTLEYFDGTDWKQLYEGTSIGQEFTLQFDPVTASGLRLNLLESKANGGKSPANITEFEVYLSNAEPPVVEEADKTILNRVIDAATELQNGEEYNNAIQLVRDSFDAALAHAVQVRDNQSATQDEVNAAWIALMNEIHKLGFTQGDKTTLKKLIEIADTFAANIDRYTPDTAEPFTAELSAAKATLADGNALQDDVTKSETALLDAMMNLRYKADKSVLETTLADAERMDTTAFTAESVEAFNVAKAQAEAVYNDVNAEQEAADKAVEALRAAISGLKPIETQDQATIQGDHTLTTGSSSAKTGEATPIAAVALISVCAAALLFKRRAN